MNHVVRKTEKSFAGQVCLECYRALMTTVHYLSSYVGTIMLFVMIKHPFLCEESRSEYSLQFWLRMFKYLAKH